MSNKSLEQKGSIILFLGYSISIPVVFIFINDMALELSNGVVFLEQCYKFVLLVILGIMSGRWLNEVKKIGSLSTRGVKK